MVTLESIKDLFQRMWADGVNTNKKLLWGYFFNDKDKKRLSDLASTLIGDGYKINDIYQDDQGEYWWLNIERIEVHNPDSLLKKCREFNAMAMDRGINSFDGYDVGNPEKNKPIK